MPKDDPFDPRTRKPPKPAPPPPPPPSSAAHILGSGPPVGSAARAWPQRIAAVLDDQDVDDICFACCTQPCQCSS